MKTFLKSVLLAALVLELTGCADRPSQTRSLSERPSTGGEAEVRLVQSAEPTETATPRPANPPEDASLFDTFADIARGSELPDVPEGGGPERVPSEIFPPEDGIEPGAEALAAEEERLIRFFQSPTWARIKARSRQNIRLANRQVRVRDCQNINIVLIVADDLGYGDVGVYGQQQIKTPNIDLLAQTGVRYTNYYSGSSVGMPAHTSLLTGLHTGHARIRGNRENAYVPVQDVTLADAMFLAGYDTGLFGGWKIGDQNTTGTPRQQGFQESFGYLNPKLAREFYPNYLWRNDERQPIPGNLNNAREHFSLELITDDAIDFMTRRRQRPFFMMVSLAAPRGKLDQAPSLEPYSSEDWPREQKQYAALVTRTDDAVGRIMDALYRRNMKENTVVILTSDNGPHKDGVNPEFFNSNGPFNGIKGTLHEGGIRVPMIVWGPSGLIRAAGGASDHVWWAPDVMPTLLDLAGAWRSPPRLDGISQLSLWRGRLAKEHQHLYWELHDDGFRQAVRIGPWKGIRSELDGPIKLYNLDDDLGEETDVASANPEIVRDMAKVMQEDRFDSPDWPVVKAQPSQ